MSVVQKDAFTVMGKEKTGEVKQDMDLWSLPQIDFYTYVEEIIPFAKKDEEVGSNIWGLASDMDDYLMPWKKEGKFVFGLEVNDDVIAPSDSWKIWKVPARTYWVVETTLDDMVETQTIIEQLTLPREGYALAGSVFEHYTPAMAEGVVELYFPIEKIS
jgi:hypothetical protein